MLQLVPVASLPTKDQISVCPTDNLLTVYKYCQQMEQVCTENFGIGLSAVQTGVAWKLFIVHYPDGKDALTKSPFGYYVNCEFEPLGTIKEKSIEGCLSLRKANGQFRHFEVERWSAVRVKGWELLPSPELRLQEFWVDLRGEYSIIFQHEIQHGMGILIDSIGKEIDIYRK